MPHMRKGHQQATGVPITTRDVATNTEDDCSSHTSMLAACSEDKLQALEAMVYGVGHNQAAMLAACSEEKLQALEVESVW